MSATPEVIPSDESERNSALAATMPKTIRERFVKTEALVWLFENGFASEWPPPKPEKPAPAYFAPGTPTRDLQRKQEQEARAAKRPKRSLNVRSLDKIDAEDVEWLWPGRVPLGQPTVLLGRMGDGKSTTISFIAATVTSGSCWPDCPDENEPGSVLFLSAEENASNAIRPRMDAFRADNSKVGIIDSVNEGDGTDSWFSLGHDVELLDAECEKRGDVKLIIVDPLDSYVTGISGYNGTEVRRYMQPLFTLAEERNLAIILVIHPNKDAEKDILDRASGSGAYLQMVRMAWYLSEAPGDKSRRWLTALKTSCDGAVETGLACHYDKPRRRMTWFDDPVRHNGREVDYLLQKQAREAKLNARPGPDPVATNRAMEFLLDLLKAGPCMQSAAQDLAMNQGIKESSFRKGLKRLISDDGRVVRERRGEDSRWWVLLSADRESPPGEATPGGDPAQDEGSKESPQTPPGG
jgi:putative DNA primase/helicase